MQAGAFARSCAGDPVGCLREEPFSRFQHRMAGRGFTRSGRCQHQQSRNLRGHLTEVFEQRLALEYVCDSAVV
jgi:hypothetical protein